MISVINMVYGPGFNLTLYLLWFLIFVVCVIVCMERERGARDGGDNTNDGWSLRVWLWWVVQMSNPRPREKVGFVIWCISLFLYIFKSDVAIFDWRV